MIKYLNVFFILCFIFGCKNKDDGQPKPIAEFSYQIEFGGYVSFFDNSINTISQRWDFGNGLTSTDKNPTTVFNKNGEYLVVLTAQGKSKQSTTSKKIKITGIEGVITVYSASAQNSKMIDVYANGVFLGEVNGKSYHLSLRDCWENSGIHNRLQEGEYTITAKEQGGSKTWYKRVNVKSGECLLHGLD